MNESRDDGTGLSYDQISQNDLRSKYLDTTYMSDPEHEGSSIALEPMSPLVVDRNEKLNLGLDEISVSRSLVHPYVPVQPNVVSQTG